MEKDLTELRAALEQMQRRVESLEAELEDVLSQLEARQAPPPPAMGVPQRQASAHCPFGDVRNFGVRLEGADIRVSPGLAYHAGVPYYTAETLLEDVEDGDNICLKYHYVTGVTVIATDLDGDSDGDIIRVLGVVAVTGGSARISKWYGGGVEISAKGK